MTFSSIESAGHWHRAPRSHRWGPIERPGLSSIQGPGWVPSIIQVEHHAWSMMSHSLVQVGPHWGIKNPKVARDHNSTHVSPELFSTPARQDQRARPKTWVWQADFFRKNREKILMFLIHPFFGGVAGSDGATEGSVVPCKRKPCRLLMRPLESEQGTRWILSEIHTTRDHCSRLRMGPLPGWVPKKGLIRNNSRFKLKIKNTKLFLLLWLKFLTFS